MDRDLTDLIVRPRPAPRNGPGGNTSRRNWPGAGSAAAAAAEAVRSRVRPAESSASWSTPAKQQRMLAMVPTCAGCSVSVVVPSWNCGPYLALCLDSLLTQTHAIEIIVVNDRSTDETGELLGRYAGRVRVIHHDRQRGANAARNTGLRAASGEWIVFADADGVYRADWIQRLLAAAQSRPGTGVVYSGFLRRFADSRTQAFPSRDWSPTALWWENYIDMASLVRREALPDQGLDESSEILDDWQLWLELASRGWTGHRIEDELYTSWIREDGKTRSFERQSHRRAGVVARLRRRYADLAGIDRAIAVVIPACGSEDLTVRCLEHLALYCGVPFHVFYVDNGSPPSAVEAVREAAGQHGVPLTVLQNATNEGFTPAVNRGLRAAGYRHCLVLNNDCFVGPNCVERLWYTLVSNERCVAAGPLSGGRGAQSVLLPGAVERFGAHPAIRDHAGDAVQAAMLLEQRQRCIEVPMLAFFCTLLHRDALRDIGLLEERFRSGLVADDEWCHRARASGGRCLLVLNAYAAHLHSETFRRLGLDYEALHRAAIATLRQ